MSDVQLKVTGRADIGAITRGLKTVERDYKNIERVVNKGTMQGGKVSPDQLASLKAFTKRYQETTAEVAKMRSAEIQAVRELKEARKSATNDERSNIDKQVKTREKLINKLQEEYDLTERLQKLQKEVSSYKVTESAGKVGGGGGLGGALSKAWGFGKTALGIAGIFGIGNMLVDAYQKAVAREIAVSDLGMRIGGTRPNFSGLRSTITSTGLRYGYNGLESMQALDTYSSMGGRIGAGDQASIMSLTRAYGLDLNQEAGILGRARATGAYKSGQLNEFASALARAIDSGKMQERAAEAQEATVSLLENAVSIMPRLSADVVNGIIGLQTQLNKSGAEGLRGQQGASIIEKLGSLFTNPSNRTFLYKAWVAEGGNPNDYGTFREQLEEGATPKNLQMLSKHLNLYTSGADASSAKLLKQMFFESNGLTFHQFDELNKATNGFTNFGSLTGSPDAIANRVAGWDTSTGATVQKTDAAYEEALARAGTGLIPVFNSLKDTATSLINRFTDFAQWVDDFLKNHGLSGGIVNGTTVALAGGALALLGGKKLIGKGLSKVFSKGGQKVVGEVAEEVAEEGTEQATKGGILSWIKNLGKGGKAGAVNDALANAWEGKVAYTRYLDEAEQAMAQLKAGKAVTIPRFAGKNAQEIGKMVGTYTKGLNEFDDIIAKGGSGVIDDVVESAAKTGGKSLLKRGASALAKGAPVIGGLIDFGLNRAIDPDEPMARSIVRAIGSTLGGLGGGALGSLAGPVGTFAGGVAGGMGGDFLGSKVFDLLTGYVDDSQNEIKYLRGDGVQRLTDLSSKGVISLQGLDDNGRQYIEQLEKEGLLKIENFRADGSVDISNLSDNGSQALLDLFKEGKLAFGKFTDAANQMTQDIEEYITNTINTRTGETNLGGNVVKSLPGEDVDMIAGSAYNVFGSDWQKRITSRFGDISSIRGGDPHSGLDIDGNQGDVLRAFLGGKITAKGADKLSGNYLTVQDALSGLTYSYAHLSGYGKSIGGDELGVGDVVAPGSILGYMGGDASTPGEYGPGRSTGSHLHITMKNREGELIDPEDVLKDLPMSPVYGKSSTDAPYQDILNQINAQKPHWTKVGGGFLQSDKLRLEETGEEYDYTPQNSLSKNAGKIKVGDTWMTPEEFTSKYYKKPSNADNKWLHRFDGATFDQGGGTFSNQGNIWGDGSQATVKQQKVTVEVNVNDKNGTLNSMTVENLKNMINQAIADYQKGTLLNNPIIRTQN